MVQSTSPQPLDLILVGNKKSMGAKKVDCRVPVLDIKFRNKSLCPYFDIDYDSLKRNLNFYLIFTVIRISDNPQFNLQNSDLKPEFQVLVFQAKVLPTILSE